MKNVLAGLPIAMMVTIAGGAAADGLVAHLDGGSQTAADVYWDMFRVPVGERINRMVSESGAPLSPEQRRATDEIIALLEEAESTLVAKLALVPVPDVDEPSWRLSDLGVEACKGDYACGGSLHEEVNDSYNVYTQYGQDIEQNACSGNTWYVNLVYGSNNHYCYIVNDSGFKVAQSGGHVEAKTGGNSTREPA